MSGLQRAKRPNLPERSPETVKQRERRQARATKAQGLGIPFQPNRPAPTIISTTIDYEARNRLLREIGFDSYKRYLESELWKHIRARVLKRDQHTCFRCGGNGWMVHHLHYSKPVLLGKDIEPLLVVCLPCHQKIEFTPRGQKRTLAQAAKSIGIDIQSSESPAGETAPWADNQGRPPIRNANTTRP